MSGRLAGKVAFITGAAMKIDRIRGYGATVHVIRGYYAEAYAACEERA